MKRRDFVGSAVVGVATAAGSASVAAQAKTEWRMVTAYPKNLPILQTACERLGRRITEMTEGRLTVKVYAAGELVPALQCFDAVSSGAAEMGVDSAYYAYGKTKSSAFFSGVPFGMTAQEMNAWIHWGGGQQLWDEAYAPFGVRAWLAGNSGVQMGGWFRKEIKVPEDFRGLKFRMPGIGGEVLKKLGASVVLLPGSELFGALQSGAIDGTEWVSPYIDSSMGFSRVAKFYYWPGFHEPCSAVQAMVNRSKFDALPKDVQRIVTAAIGLENDLMLAEFTYRNGPALQGLVNDQQVQLRQYPRDVTIALGNASGEVMQELVDGADPITKKVAVSFLKARKEMVNWTRIGEAGFANARSLPFKFPE